MCGIFGWNFTKKARLPAGKRAVLASTLAVSNSLRGDQSWGAYLQARKGAARLEHCVGDVADHDGIGTWGLFDTVFAHTRWATTGKLTKDNCHPFTVGKVTLAHNGMVFNHDELNKKYGRACEVDSMHLAHHISEGLPFTDCEGYGAVEYVTEARPRLVYLSRMRNGSLHVYGVKNSRGATVGVVWSSDDAHLKSALGAARLDAFPFKALVEGKLYEARDGYLYESGLPDLKLGEPALTDSEMKLWCGRTSGRGKWTWDARTKSYGSATKDHVKGYTVTPSGVVEFDRDAAAAAAEDAEDAEEEAWVEDWYQRQDLAGSSARAQVKEGKLGAKEAGLTAIDSARGLYANEEGEIVEIDSRTGLLKPTGQHLPELGGDLEGVNDTEPDVYGLTEEAWIERQARIYAAE